MQCRNCGSQEADSAKFCSQCGAPLPGPPETVPQPPPAPSWTPSAAPATDYEALRRLTAEQRSFTTPAIITLVLYLALWLPGFIANLVYLNEANNVERVAGRAPEGKGCLVALLAVFVVAPALLFCLFLGFGVVGAASS